MQGEHMLGNGAQLADIFPELPRPACRVVLVAGPPGAGKSRHVAESAAPGDLVIDLDDIAAELSGLPLYAARWDEWSRPALQERNRRLRSLADVSPYCTAWVIVCAPGGAFGWWRRALRGPRVVSIVPPQWQCRERIARDPRRAHDLARHLAACDDWFARNTRALQAVRRSAAGRPDYDE